MTPIRLLQTLRAGRWLGCRKRAGRTAGKRYTRFWRTDGGLDGAGFGG